MIIYILVLMRVVVIEKLNNFSVCEILGYKDRFVYEWVEKVR